jgi:uncharacterized phage infection (PIP) family protein YhgE
MPITSRRQFNTSLHHIDKTVKAMDHLLGDLIRMPLDQMEQAHNKYQALQKDYFDELNQAAKWIHHKENQFNPRDIPAYKKAVSSFMHVCELQDKITPHLLTRKEFKTQLQQIDKLIKKMDHITDQLTTMSFDDAEKAGRDYKDLAAELSTALIEAKKWICKKEHQSKPKDLFHYKNRATSTQHATERMPSVHEQVKAQKRADHPLAPAKTSTTAAHPMSHGSSIPPAAPPTGTSVRMSHRMSLGSSSSPSTSRNTDKTALHDQYDKYIKSHIKHLNSELTKMLKKFPKLDATIKQLRAGLDTFEKGNFSDIDRLKKHFNKVLEKEPHSSCHKARLLLDKVVHAFLKLCDSIKKMFTGKSEHRLFETRKTTLHMHVDAFNKALDDMAHLATTPSMKPHQ